jgi:hypothetical protein
MGVPRTCLCAFVVPLSVPTFLNPEASASPLICSRQHLGAIKICSATARKPLAKSSRAGLSCVDPAHRTSALETVSRIDCVKILIVANQRAILISALIRPTVCPLPCISAMIQLIGLYNRRGSPMVAFWRSSGDAGDRPTVELRPYGKSHVLNHALA